MTALLRNRELSVSGRHCGFGLFAHDSQEMLVMNAKFVTA